ncbi:MAG: hypothetical protein IBX61_04390 [Thermoleophilia bacterium]|nr:hypothetical protein [Thermoleophilia bacterium]
MKLMQGLENLLMAAAFAEEGEFDTARQMAAEAIPESGKAKDSTPVLKRKRETRRRRRIFPSPRKA